MFNVLKSMFNGLFWNIHYNRFLDDYDEDNFQQHYKELNFFKSIEWLIKHIPEKKYSSYYNANIHIPTYYENFIAWFNSAKQLRESMELQDLRINQALPDKVIALSTFLETDDGKSIEYGSAIAVAMNELTLIYNCLSKLERTARDFYLRQYREVYITGLFFLYTLIYERGNY